MGAVLKIVANPAVQKLVGGLIDKLFNGKGKNDPVDPKVSAPVATGAIVTVILTVLAVVDPGLGDVLKGVGIEAVVAQVAAAVAGVMTVVTAVVGYYQARN